MDERKALGMMVPLMEDIWQAITIIYPEFAGSESPVHQLHEESQREEAGYYWSPDFDEHGNGYISVRKDVALLGDWMGEPVAEIPPGLVKSRLGPTLAHELTHHLQYLRGEGGLGSRGDFHLFDPNEQEANEMAVALFWDFLEGQYWRHAQSIEIPDWQEEHDRSWTERLCRQARAQRLRWERLEKALEEEVAEWERLEAERK